MILLDGLAGTKDCGLPAEDGEEEPNSMQNGMRLCQCTLAVLRLPARITGAVIAELVCVARAVIM